MIGVEVEGATVVVTMTGMVSDDDWDAAVSALEDQLGRKASIHLASPKSPNLRVLMDWEKLEGWERGTRSTCTWFCMGNQDVVDRVAVIADDRWRDELERLVDIYKNAQVNFYFPIQREHALKWLKEREE